MSEGTVPLVTATPALRRSFIVSVLIAVLFALSAANNNTADGVDRIIVFLTMAPLVPLAGVALAFGPRVDPTHEVALAAPIDGFRLFLIRALTVVGASTLVLLLASMLVPAGGTHRVAWLLPALAATSVDHGALDPTRSPIRGRSRFGRVDHHRHHLGLGHRRRRGIRADDAGAEPVRRGRRCGRIRPATTAPRRDVRPMTAPTVALDAVQHRYGAADALAIERLVFEPGSTAVLGPNGSGKSTLLRLLATVAEIQSGTIRVGGLDPADQIERTAIRRRLGYVAQRDGLPPRMRVGAFCDYVGALKEIDSARLRRRWTTWALDRSD